MGTLEVGCVVGVVTRTAPMRVLWTAARWKHQRHPHRCLLTLILDSFVFPEPRTHVLNKSPIVFYLLNLLSQSQSCYHFCAPAGPLEVALRAQQDGAGGGRTSWGWEREEMGLRDLFLEHGWPTPQNQGHSIPNTAPNIRGCFSFDPTESPHFPRAKERKNICFVIFYSKPHLWSPSTL